MNMNIGPATPPASLNQVAPPQPAAAPVQALPAEAAPEAESKMGLLDYPKEGLLAVTQMAAKGQAKNIMEFAEDLNDIKTAGKELVQDLKAGKLLSALGNVGKMVGNAVSANVNAMQAGVAGLAAGASAVVATPFVVLDAGAEAIGKALDSNNEGLGASVGKAFQFLGGQNSDQGIYGAVRAGQREGVASALAGQAAQSAKALE